MEINLRSCSVFEHFLLDCEGNLPRHLKQQQKPNKWCEIEIYLSFEHLIAARLSYIMCIVYGALYDRNTNIIDDIPL